MLSEPLPKRVRFANLVAKQVILTGSMQLGSFLRLSAIVQEQRHDGAIQVNAQDCIEAQLEFYRGEDARPKVKGWARWSLELPCQRCLNVVRIELVSSIMTTIVRTDKEMAGLDENEDGQSVSSDDLLDVVELLEDSLILELPMSPKHSRCSEVIPNAVADEQNLVEGRGTDSTDSSSEQEINQKISRDSGVKQDTHRPFAELKKLTGLHKE
ncbi:MAG TPA: hypothetical protein EYQ22_14020 [Gammaproteobacteria bacterium]|nr:hypothetical protein [Gammaproteobacteria bacterium]HIK68758.1 hypothetical protein [Pseudomonadales bacterium]